MLNEKNYAWVPLHVGVQISIFAILTQGKFIMADVETLVSGIDYKIHRLIERLQSLKEKSEKQSKEIHELNQNKEEQNQTINDLEEKVKIIKTTKTLEINEGTVEAKAKINELLREIDNCIGLLNR